MQTIAADFSVSRVDSEREIHWKAVGLWDEAMLAKLFEALLDASKPFREDRKGFRVFGDLSEFAVQKREIADTMRQSQEASAQVGVDRMAIIYSSILLKQQFRRISDALDCRFFEDRTEALAWLREGKA